ncbi:DSD1 family PLP-dependent enzyme [Marinobacter zhejiangensis]|uniref:D-serine deaminase, pyridoxal phosphate-dependent n=1 Tax=Marinobacter zhejiangensis TaxID=488535 RepID=A0A1I4LXA3_9GAMM|nr:DSD1 family PLP-dependent enzyme [Marinobacter zhejiangensis]SFL95582.1 D-serine deaminase, pyridoxal phosphate-dependent [Marinobacter zhejiangensis]
MSQSDAFSRSRRRLLLGGSALALAGGAGWLRPARANGQHSAYFQGLNETLRHQDRYQPLLVIDRQRLLTNIDTLSQQLAGQYHYRIVAKSLPSIPLLKLVMARANTRRLMVFHQPFLNQVATDIPEADVLMGKPMPVQAARRFYREQSRVEGHPGFDPARQLQWLVDTPQRLAQYDQLARELDQSLQINIEIDIGLHRGGVQALAELDQMLRRIEQSPRLQFSGFMGYEPHIVKAPGANDWLRDQAMARYQAFVDQAEQTLGRSIRDLTLNTGGSTTYPLYRDLQDHIAPNEIAAGSVLVKPTDFDLPTLSHHEPAAFIATPVLKVLDRTEIPGAPGLGRVMGWWNPNREKAIFIYGGYWKAHPESPSGLTTNPVYGRSTNQEMLNAGANFALVPDDWVFLRPTQSEQVFLEFNGIEAYDSARHQLAGHWPVLRQHSV